MNSLSSKILRNYRLMDTNIDTAFALQKIAIPMEFLAVLIAVGIFQQQLYNWFFLALTLSIGRCLIYVFANKRNNQFWFICSNILSMCTWISFSIICSYMSYFNVMVATLLLTGLVSGALLFITYVRYLFIFYSALILGVFAIMIMSKGGVLTTVGGGLIILVIFLSSLSQQYNTLSSSYFESSRINSLLYDEENKQVNTLSMLRDRLHASSVERQLIENKIVESNDLLQKSIQKSINDDELLQEEIFLIYQKVGQGILLSDEHSDHLAVNQFFSTLWGIEEKEQYQREQLRELIAAQIKSDSLLFLHAFPFIKNTHSSTVSFELTKTDGKIIEVQIKTFRKQGVLQNLWVFKDITNLLSNALSISQLGQFDSLTQLASRRQIYSYLTHLVERYQSNDLNFALAFIDINDFKLINDSLGHGVGNDIIKIFATRLKQNIRAIDFVGRLGGDEFICIFNELTYKSDADPLINKLKAGLEEPITLNNTCMIINASIGVSFYPCDTASIDELISFADIAMYRAKENSNSIYERFLPQYTEQVNQMHVVGQELKSALINNSFYLVYQPIYETNTHQIAKVEVLLRWHEHALPSFFIPLAERLGLIHDIGLWVLRESCKARYELSKLPELADSDIKFSVNISSRQLQTQKQINELLEQVANSPCKPEWLEFELTESTLVDLEKAMAFISTLKSLGISVAIDDFGTGFSSLSYLKNIHFDVIKIDKYFLDNIFEKPREMNIFQAIIHLAHMLEAKITIEGVETKAQYDYCVQAQCQFIQGFYMSRPIDFVTLIEKLTDSEFSKNSAQSQSSTQNLKHGDLPYL